VSVKTKAYGLALHQNRPNPFNPSTTISFTLPEKARATLSIYDVQGRLMRTLVDEIFGEGYRERIWDGRDAGGSQVGSGVYFCRLTAGNKTLTKKMVLLK
jgi:flagellar hook assembly protein FlgD